MLCSPWHQVCEGSEGATRLGKNGARGSLQKNFPLSAMEKCNGGLISQENLFKMEILVLEIYFKIRYIKECARRFEKKKILFVGPITQQNSLEFLEGIA